MDMPLLAKDRVKAALNIILGEIRRDQLPFRLPSEEQLATQEAVSRDTVRKALAEVISGHETSGYRFESRRGSGHYVVRIPDMASGVESTTDLMQQLGLHTRAELLDVPRLLQAKVDLARKLSVDVGDLVFKLHRLRFRGEKPDQLEPYALQRTFIALSRCPDPEQIRQALLAADFTTASLYQVLHDNGVFIQRSQSSLYARHAGSYKDLEYDPRTGQETEIEIDEAAQLGKRQGDRPIVMLRYQTSYTDSGHAIEYVREVYLAELTHFRFDESAEVSYQPLRH